MKNVKIFFPLAALLALVFLSYKTVNATNVPPLKEGTYLSGQTLSTWPSWSTLGNTLGVALPTDPINQLAMAGTCVTSTNRFCLTNDQCPAGETCVLHDPETGWSVADRRFTFACSRDSYAYRYIASTTPGVYTVRAHFEDPGILPANYNSFVASFISTTIFKINDASGVCNFDQEISSMQSGVCGDGKLNLNKGEQCDPPGRIEYQTGCRSSGGKIIKDLKVCGKNCQWTASTTPCGSLSKCGNGSLEFGETCDDGIFNGRYNKCNIACNGVSALGKCGDAVTQSVYEVCDPGTPGVEKYALSKAASCSWDCQNFGPYCGDTIVQTQYEEECETSQICSVDGNPGIKVCADNCQKKDKDAVAWWRFEKFMAPAQTADASANANTANCNSPSKCPVVGAGKYGRGFTFSSDSGNLRSLLVFSSPSLITTSSLTVEAWIFPIRTSTLYQRIVEKLPVGTGVGGGYGLEFNNSVTASKARFNLWNFGSQTSVDSNSDIATGTWTHVVGTYARNGNSNVIKIYINGVLENTNVIGGSIMGKDTGNLAIGKSATGIKDFFFGSLDEVKIYNRALSADEVQNNFQSGWFCAATSTPTIIAAAGSCGDNVVDSNEACDRGSANNGRFCVPTYGTPCSYCSADCQNTIDVQPVEYCGNGVIESSEKCEVAGGNIFSAASTTGRTVSAKDPVANGYQELACANETPAVTHAVKKGAKTCADCSVGVVRNCVRCGIDANGVKVEGNIVNVLENPITNSLLDPLFVKKITYGALSLAVSLCKSSTGAELCPIWLPPVSPLVARVLKDIHSNPSSYTLTDPHVSGYPPALINSDPICSAGDSFNDKYQMYVNYDWSRPLNFPVVAEPRPWQYDLVLSPVVSSTKRAKDLRVVVSWVGSGDFYSGVLNPFISNPQVEGSSYVSCSGAPCLLTYQYATGTNYYNSPASFKASGIWYHGFNSTPGQTSAEAFTIDTAAMSGNTYSFYVRAPSYPIRTFKNTARLKVDVYLPEQDNDPYHFGTPIKTYNFLFASPSDNPNARYWQVFNINAPSSNLSVSDIIDINAIVTGPAYFKYTNPLVANPTCTEADWLGYYSLKLGYPTGVSCPASGTLTKYWKKLTNCIGGVTHPTSETVTCVYGTILF